MNFIFHTLGAGDGFSMGHIHFCRAVQYIPTFLVADRNILSIMGPVWGWEVKEKKI
jgi:hypothetical protein